MSTRVALAGLLIGANFTGAVVTFCYLTFIDLATRGDSPDTTLDNSLFFPLGFTIVMGLAVWIGARWRVPPPGPDVDVEEPEIRRRALALPRRMAAVAAIGWTLAGILWGVVRPAMAGEYSLAGMGRLLIGITLIGGSITTAFTFFAVEQRWRRVLPAYFPRGDLSAVPEVARLPVRARLLAIFLLAGVLPLVVMATLALNRAHRMLGADPVTANVLLHNMAVSIVFLLAVGLVTAVGLALFVSRSVAAPLRDLERAMARVGRGELDAHAPVVSQDEIGAVAEGFNRMVAGLRERERIRETFGKYVSPEVRDEILAGNVRLEGQRREVTILFSDLRDFTPWVESQPPEDVVRDINGYFTLMEGAIRAHGGLIVQFIGDEIEAVFGAPIAAPRHADQALAAALEMCRRLETWNESRRASGAIVLRHGIGVHTGEVIVASIGSPERLSYALVGDPVNLASRIQGLTKEVGGEVLVSGDTVRQLNDTSALQALPAVRVKGRMAEVEVYRAA